MDINCVTQEAKASAQPRADGDDREKKKLLLCRSHCERNERLNDGKYCAPETHRRHQRVSAQKCIQRNFSSNVWSCRKLWSIYCRLSSSVSCQALHQPEHATLPLHMRFEWISVSFLLLCNRHEYGMSVRRLMQCWKWYLDTIATDAKTASNFFFESSGQYIVHPFISRRKWSLTCDVHWDWNYVCVCGRYELCMRWISMCVITRWIRCQCVHCSTVVGFVCMRAPRTKHKLREQRCHHVRTIQMP